MYLWWSLFTLYLLTCLVTVTVDDSGLRCCVACYMYDPLSSAFNSLCLLSLLKRILIFLHATFCVLILQCYVLYYPSHPIHSWDLCLLSNHGGILSFPNWTYGSNNKKIYFHKHSAPRYCRKTQKQTLLKPKSIETAFKIQSVIADITEQRILLWVLNTHCILFSFSLQSSPLRGKNS